jgi:hypothetical protein
MLEDPDIIRANIKHYEYLLTLYSTKHARDDLRRLIASAQAQLHLAMATASKKQETSLAGGDRRVT